jgi:hypothetical protein
MPPEEIEPSDCGCWYCRLVFSRTSLFDLNGKLFCAACLDAYRDG